MIKVKKITKIINGRKVHEEPEGLVFNNKCQMEIYRDYLMRTNNVTRVFFIYEEHR